MSTSRSAHEIRSSLGHPVIDADGHTTEFVPALAEYLREVGIDTDFNELFRGGPESVCPDAADCNGDGVRQDAPLLPEQ